MKVEQNTRFLMSLFFSAVIVYNVIEIYNFQKEKWKKK